MEPGQREELERKVCELMYKLCSEDRLQMWDLLRRKNEAELGCKLPDSGDCPVERRKYIISAFFWAMVNLIENDQDTREFRWESLIKEYLKRDPNGISSKESLKSSIEFYKSIRDQFSFDFIKMAQRGSEDPHGLLLESSRFKPEPPISEEDKRSLSKAVESIRRDGGSEFLDTLCFKHYTGPRFKLPGTGYCVQCPDYEPVRRREYLIYALLWQMVTFFENDPGKREFLWKNHIKAYSDCNQDGIPFFKCSTEKNCKANMETLRPFRDKIRFNFIKMIFSAQLSSEETHGCLLEPPRFKLDYENLGKIGEGGYGSVYKVTNKLDCISYALKLIPFHFETKDSYMIFKREIQIFASLKSHPNLIAYKNSWLEKFTVKDKSSLSKVAKMGVPPPQTDQSSTEPEEASETRETSETPESGETAEESFTPSTSQQKPKLIGSEEDVELLNQMVKSQGNLIHDDIFFNARVLSKTTALMPGKELTFGGSLYILTELCGKNLKTWLQERNDRLFKLAPKDGQTKSLLDHIDLNESSIILKEILTGLKILHKQGVIHRDVKPENILIGLDGRWKIGDFGLATIDQYVNASASLTQALGRVQTVGLGTSFYAAPEQLNKGVDPYNRKVDIFSAGIIAFELFHPFKTDNEKSRVFENLRKNYALPDNFTTSFPKVAKMILEMTSLSPNERPDAVEILQSELFSNDGHKELDDHSEESLILKSQLSQKDAEIRRMQEEIEKQEIEIRKLNESIGKLQDGIQNIWPV